MLFRGYIPSDIEAMFSLDALCFTEPFQFDRLTMRHFAEEPGAIVLMVEDGRPCVLVAFIILHLEDSADGIYAYVVTIDVAPGHRRLGIGTAMLGRAESAARKAGALHVDLHVAADNLTAVALYESQHYLRGGITRRFYREADQDAIIFSKRL